MERRNITLSMPVELLRAARRLAAEDGTSLSELMTRALEQLVKDSRGYEDAMERELEIMKQGMGLGLRGRASWTRDELHDR